MISNKRKRNFNRLTGIENVVFGDRTQATGASNLDGASLSTVVGLYTLDRGTAPTLEQLNQMATDGLSVQTSGEQLQQQPYYQLRWADLSNGAFVTELSREVLGGR